MFRRNRAAFPALVLLACMLILPVMTAGAQDLLLNMGSNIYAVYVNEDGTADIVQEMTFTVDPSSMALDYVDVGLPNDSYDLSQVTASQDGRPLADVSRSSNIAHGVKVVLDPWLQPGETGTLRVEARVSNLLYQDKGEDEYASINLSPTYFDGQYMTGTGRLEVQLHFPVGITPEEPRWHDQEPAEKYYQDDRAVYGWIIEGDDGATEHQFGASFPASYVPAAAVQKPPAFKIDIDKLCDSPIWICGIFTLGWLVLTIIGARAKAKRKLDYLPPTVAVEGTGIKRGLTAVEAAVLLEAPLNKVMVMILFGLVKKGALTVEEQKPLKVKVTDPLPADIKLWDYELGFLQAIKPDGLISETKLRDLVVDLIGDVNKKLTGFSRKESKAYYQDIAARAWKQVEAAETPEVLGKAWGEGLEWTMLDDDWESHTRRTFQDRPVIMPSWGYGYRPWVVASSPSPSATPSAGLPSVPVTLPTLPGADFANTVVSGIENAANSVVSSVERFTGGVTEKTNPVPKTSSSSRSGGTRSSGGGRSCACACACACAGCACACAGGGR